MTRRPPDRADREWFHFLGFVTMTLAASLAIVLFATLGVTLAADLVSPAIAEHRRAIVGGGVALVWAPVAFTGMRRRLAASIARGELSAGFDASRGSAALCLAALLAAGVGIWTQDGALAGVQGSGTTFLWIVADAVFTWCALRVLGAFPALAGTDEPAPQTRPRVKRR